MINNSPFAVATPVAPVAAAVTAPFAQDLCISGITEMGKDYLVAISSRDQTQRFTLMAGETGPDGISLVSVDTDPTAPGNRRVKLKKGTELGDILFDEAVFHPPPTLPPPVVQPGVRPGMGPQRTLPRFPTAPRTTPVAAGFPRQPLTLNRPGQTNMPNQPPFQPQPTPVRRTRPIPAGPTSP
jgi:hypothetical protein